MCAEGAKLSCAFRKTAWASPTVAEPPASASAHSESASEGHLTERLREDTLLIFLPGTGTSTDKVHALSSAASDMGYFVLALSYASLPTAVSQMNLWCTRPGADATQCNVELHESVLFGHSTTAPSGGDGLWDVPPEQSVEGLLRAALSRLGWSAFLTEAGDVRWERLVVSGHSQGASHAAYLSVARGVKAAVLFSGPQEVPAAAGWVARAAQDGVLRRGVYARKEECGDAPADTSSFCALFPHRLRSNLLAMGLEAGVVGNVSGFVVVDYPPLLDEGRSHHDSVALQTKAPPPVVAMWKAILGEL